MGKKGVKRKDSSCISFVVSKENKEESQTKEAIQQRKKTLVNYMLVHSPKKRKKVDRSVNHYNVESRKVALFKAVIMELGESQLNSKIMKRSTYSKHELI